MRIRTHLTKGAPKILKDRAEKRGVSGPHIQQDAATGTPFIDGETSLHPRLNPSMVVPRKLVRFVTGIDVFRPTCSNELIRQGTRTNGEAEAEVECVDKGANGYPVFQISLRARTLQDLLELHKEITEGRMLPDRLRPATE